MWTTLHGFAGDDELNGNFGNDLLDGGDGDDRIRGEPDDDTLLGGNGNDNIIDGPGNDIVSGGAGVDTIFSDTGDDEISGGSAADVFQFSTSIGGSGSGNDIITDFNPARGDVITVQSNQVKPTDPNVVQVGSDVIITHGSANSVQGTSSDDTLDGRGGDDILKGLRGNDTLIGGNGADRFLLNTNGGQDVVMDFNPAQNDKVKINSVFVTPSNPGNEASISQVGPDVVVTIIGTTDSIRLKGLNISDWN